MVLTQLVAFQDLLNIFPVFGELLTLEILRPQGESSHSDFLPPLGLGLRRPLNQRMKDGILFGENGSKSEGGSGGEVVVSPP